MSAAVTPIRPAVATAEVTRWRCLLDPVGELQSTTWETLFAEFSRVVPFRGDDHPGWSAAVFDGDKRAKSGVLRVTAAVLDYDGTASIAKALETWSGNYGLLHTSKKHRDDAPRFRVVLPLRRPVSAFEWDILWSRLQDHCEAASDAQAKDASRFWYVPGVLPEGEFLTRRLDGQLLDPDVWLRKPPKVAPTVYVAPDRPYRDTTGGPDPEERCRRYVAKMPGSISGQNGHGSTWKVAIIAARGFALDYSATMRILREHNAHCEPRWTEKELDHKATDAAKSELPLGYKLGDERRAYRIPPEVNEDGEVIGWEPEADESELVDPEPPEAEAPAKTPRTMAEMLGAVLQRAQSGIREVGVDTCHYELQHMLAGFRPKMITVLGARTSFGKSSYAIMVADEAMRKGDGVLFISAEDGEETYAQRFMARRAKVNAFDLRANTCDDKALLRMSQQVRYAQSVPFFVDAIGKPAESIAAIIRRECKARPVKLVIVDYLQRIGTTKRTQDKRTEITHAMACISDAIKESNAAGLILSQLKRLEGGGNREPSMGDLKESGDIENMAEHVVLGWLVDDGSGEQTETTRRRWLKVEKNKDGPVDTRGIAIGFDDATASFKKTDGTAYGERASRIDDDFEPGDTWQP